MVVGILGAAVVPGVAAAAVGVGGTVSSGGKGEKRAVQDSDREVKGKPPFKTGEQPEYQEAKDEANAELREQGGRRDASPTKLAPPVFAGKNFEGVDQSVACNCVPSDNEIAVGPSHIIQVTNSHVDIWRKAPGNPPPKVLSSTLAGFFGTSDFLCDPRAIHDPTWNKWVIIAIECDPEAGTANSLHMAISTTGNAERPFFFYNFQPTGGDDFADYPMLGQDQDAVIITYNNFDPNFFNTARMFAMAKARLYNGLGFSIPLFSGLPGTLATPEVWDADQNAQAYFLAAGVHCNGNTCGSNGIVPMFAGEDLSNAFDASLAFVGDVPVNTYRIPPNAPCGAGCGQSNPSDTVDTLDARFVNSTQQVGNSLFQIHAPDVGGAAGLRWYEIDIPSVSAIQQQSTFTSGTSHDFNPSIAANASGAGGQNEIYATWTTFCFDSCNNTTNNSNAQVRFSGRQDGVDAANVLPMPGALVANGLAPYTGTLAGAERWGDYSGIALDPQNYTLGGDICPPYRRAWLTNQRNTTSTNWSTRIVRVQFC